MVTVSKRIVVAVLGKDSGHSLGKDSGNSLQKEFPNGDCYLGLQNLTKSRGGVQKSIFLQKKWIFRWSVTEIHQHGPTTFGVGRKKFAKIHFFTEKFRVYTTFYRNSSARTHKIWGRTKKFAKIHFFTEKISALLDLLQKFVRRPKRPKKGNCYHYTYKGCYLFIFTK